MPSIHNLVLFLHVSSDIGLFIGIGIQLLTLTALRRVKNTEQARTLIGLIKMSEPLSIISGLLLLASGLYLALRHWSLQNGWIAVSLGSLVVVMPLLIRGVVDPRLRVIITMVKEAKDTPLPESLYRRIHDPVLGAGVQTLAAFVLGIVFLMTAKPALVTSIAVIAFALVIGVLSGLPLRRQEK
jgi:uncharacterized membrane protein